MPAGRPFPDEKFFGGLGVILLSAEGSLDLAFAAGVLSAVLGRDTEASDMRGDGGSCNSDTVSLVAMDFESGGVVMRGELAVEPVE